MAAFERPGEAGDPESWHRRPDGDGGPDRADQGADDRRARRPETEAQAAERLGLTGLNRSDAYDSLRAKADAQEAEIRQRDIRARGEDRDGRRDEAADAGQREDEPAEPERADRGSGAPGDAEMAHWTTEPTEDRPDRDPERHPHYWTEVPRFQASWEHLEERWPHTERSPEGGRQLDPERRAMTEEAVERVSDAEPAISDDIRKVEAENASGGWLEGFDKFRLKDKDRIMEKVADKLGVEPDRNPEDVAREVPDAIRYTYCFNAQDYARGYHEIKGSLERCGYEMYYSKNWWNDPEYKGINTRWITSEGQRFEVQFHTVESFHAKHEVTHRAYERLRDPATTDDHERLELRQFQREVSSWIPIPMGTRELPDYKKEGF